MGGISMPLVGARGYSVTLAGEGVPPAHALYLAEAKLGLSTYDSGVRVAGVFELGATGTEPPLPRNGGATALCKHCDQTKQRHRALVICERKARL